MPVIFHNKPQRKTSVRPDQRAKKPRPMVEGDNDRTIVQHVYNYRLLTQAQLETLLGRSRATVQRLLRRLYNHRYLERQFLPIRLSGSSPAIYSLDRRGIQLLRRLGIEPQNHRLIRPKSALFLSHTVHLNDFRIAVATSATHRGWTLNNWIDENDLKQQAEKVKIAGGSRVTLIPDGYFALQSASGAPAHFFVELDRGTMTVKRFRRKVEAYVAYYKSGHFRSRYGASAFRVLTVVADAGQARVEHLNHMAGSVPGAGRRFWFAHINDLHAPDVFATARWLVGGQVNFTALHGSKKRGT